MIDRYLQTGDMFLMEKDGQAVSVCVCLPLSEEPGILEIKNLAVHPSFQRKGIGRSMIAFIENGYRGEYSVLQVGTGDSPLTVPFTVPAVLESRIELKIFLQKTTITPFYEGGVKLTDMVCMRKSI